MIAWRLGRLRGSLIPNPGYSGCKVFQSVVLQDYDPPFEPCTTTTAEIAICTATFTSPAGFSSCIDTSYVLSTAMPLAAYTFFYDELQDWGRAGWVRREILYTPSIIPETVGLGSITGFVSQTISSAQDTDLNPTMQNSHTSNASSTTATSLPESASIKSDSRCQDYDSSECHPRGRPDPDAQDVATNSVFELCSIVGRNRDYFVSLKPPDAAYLPLWVGYLVSGLLTTFQTVSLKRSMNRTACPQKLGCIGIALSVVGTTIALMRTSLAVYKLSRHRNSLEELPFVSPLLWVDWLSLYTAARRSQSQRLAWLSGIVAATVYVICFWLTIGYSQRGHGFATVALISTGGCQLEGWTGYGAEELQYAISVLTVLPLASGAIVADVINWKTYILFNKGECIVLYVSGRWGYVDTEYIDWYSNVATWLGITT